MKIEFVASASASEVLAVLVNEGRSFVGTGSQLDAVNVNVPSLPVCAKALPS